MRILATHLCKNEHLILPCNLVSGNQKNALGMPNSLNTWYLLDFFSFLQASCYVVILRSCPKGLTLVQISALWLPSRLKAFCKQARLIKMPPWYNSPGLVLPVYIHLHQKNNVISILRFQRELKRHFTPLGNTHLSLLHKKKRKLG